MVSLAGPGVLIYNPTRKPIEGSHFPMFQHLDYIVVVYLLPWRPRGEIKSKAASSYCTYREDKPYSGSKKQKKKEINHTAIKISLTIYDPHKDKTKYQIIKRSSKYRSKTLPQNKLQIQNKHKSVRILLQFKTSIDSRYDGQKSKDVI